MLGEISDWLDESFSPCELAVRRFGVEIVGPHSHIIR